MPVNVKKIKKQLSPVKKKTPAPDRISTGSTLLNLAVSGNPDEAFSKGQFILFVGDSQAGKSWLALQIMAEASCSRTFDQHELIHDNPERGTLMDIARYYGIKLANRIRPPSPSGPSRFLEEFYDHVDDAVKAGKPFVYVLDSEDALKSEQEWKKSAVNKSIRRGTRKGEIKGDYGDGKAKKNSSGLRMAHNDVADTGSLLIMIKQTRDNIGIDAEYNPKTRSGGRALTFYASCEVWFSVKGKIRKSIRGKNRVIGTILRIHVKKNRVAGRDRTVDLHFYPTVGIDDTGSCVGFLVEEAHWKETKGKLIAPEFDFMGSQEDLVKKIEAEGWENDLKKIVAGVWTDIESACTVERKNRYG